MANPLDVVTRFSSDVSGLQKGANEAKEAIGGISPTALLAGASIVGAAGLAVSAIAGMTQAAAEDEAQQLALEQAITGAGAATSTSTQQVNDAIAAGQAKAFTDTQTRLALESLVTSTHDVTKATDLLSTAQDVARFANVDLSVAADAVAKANSGQAGALQKLLPGLEKGKTATDTLANAQKLAAGAADTYADSTEGQMAVASDAFGELGETIGYAFLPILKALLPPLIALIKLLGDIITTALPPLEAGIGVVIEVTKILIDAWLDEYKILFTIVGLIASKLAPLLPIIAAAFRVVASAVGGVVDWLKQLLDWIGRAVDAIGTLLDNLNPLKGFSLPSLPFSLGASATGYGASPAGRSGGAGTFAGGVTINVYGGDPRRVAAAVREGYRRWTGTDGANAPERPW
jgi:hypothetical protein